MTDHQTRAIVVGGGPAGWAAALALAHAGVATTIAAPRHQVAGGGTDRRTAALFTSSIELLRNLGVWDDLFSACEPIGAIRLVDDRGALLRTPEVTFRAADVGLDVFGWNVPNEALMRVLTAEAAREALPLTWIETKGVTSVETDSTCVRVTTAEGEMLSADLIAAADGRNSISRAAAGIDTETWSYPQSALVATFAHGRAHGGVSTEFHRPHGPCTTVPLPGRHSSLVWVEQPEEALRLAALSDDDFRRRLDRQLNGLLGEIGAIGGRAIFPLSGLTARSFGDKRVALIGEAGHVIPPIGAQGLNLGLRDAATLADFVAKARAEGRDIGAADVLSAFSAQRRLDVTSRIYTVDLLNRSLISSLVPVHLARGLGIHVLKAFGPLRRLVVREGLAPSDYVPTLMSPGGSFRGGRGKAA